MTRIMELSGKRHTTTPPQRLYSTPGDQTVDSDDKISVNGPVLTRRQPPARQRNTEAAGEAFNALKDRIDNEDNDNDDLNGGVISKGREGDQRDV